MEKSDYSKIGDKSENSKLGEKTEMGKNLEDSMEMVEDQLPLSCDVKDALFLHFKYEVFIILKV